MILAYAVLFLSILPGSAATKGRPPVGTNLNGLSYYSTEMPFWDSFKAAGAWVSGTKENWNDGRRPMPARRASPWA